MHVVYMDLILAMVNIGIGVNAYMKGDDTLIVFGFVVSAMCLVGAYSRYLLIKTRIKNKELMDKFYPKD